MSNHHTDAEHGFSVDNDRDELAPSSRTHWAHPTETVPACIVAGVAVLRNEVCVATDDRLQVTCEECLPLLPNVLARAGAVTAGELGAHEFEAADPDTDDAPADTCRQCGVLQGDHHRVRVDGLPDGADDWHKAAWIQTFTGRAFRPFMATVDDLDCQDIAHSLSMQCRYNGHVNRFYSVAEHAVLMSETFTDRGDALWALLHDGAEAYIGDMVRPLKITDAMKPYRDLDDHLTAMIATKWELPGTTIPASVKEADNRILLDERAELLSEPAEQWELGGAVEPLGVTIKGWYPPAAELMWLKRLDELDGAGW